MKTNESDEPIDADEDFTMDCERRTYVAQGEACSEWVYVEHDAPAATS